MVVITLLSDRNYMRDLVERLGVIRSYAIVGAGKKLKPIFYDNHLGITRKAASICTQSVTFGDGLCAELWGVDSNHRYPR